MTDDNNKCAHEVCACMKREDSDYCSDSCKTSADSDKTEIACNCGHAKCS